MFPLVLSRSLCSKTLILPFSVSISRDLISLKVARLRCLSSSTADAPMANSWGVENLQVRMSSSFFNLRNETGRNYLFLGIRLNDVMPYGIERNICSFSFDGDRLVMDSCLYESVIGIQLFVVRCLENVHPHHQLSPVVLQFLKDEILGHLWLEMESIRSEFRSHVLMHVEIAITIKDNELNQDDNHFEMMVGNYLDDAVEILSFNEDESQIQSHRNPNGVAVSNLSMPQLLGENISKEKYMDMGANTCSVCHQAMVDHNVMETICVHRFCENCIQTWLKLRRECPVCRSRI